jgi:hypothetical protein
MLSLLTESDIRRLAEHERTKRLLETVAWLLASLRRAIC